LAHSTGDNGNGRTKVAILGGGPASLAAAYYLTTKEKGKYDITIYEMSWRLGGKTSSGRNRDGRIEEHGLHVLFGGYHNAFDMMLGCYDEVRDECGPDTLAFGSFFDALTPGDFGVIGDDREGPWRRLDLEFPVNRGVPGDTPLPTTWDLASGVLQTLLQILLGARAIRFLHRLMGRLIGYRRRFPRVGRERARNVTTNPDGGDWFLRRVIIPGSLAALDRDRLIGWTIRCALAAAHWCVRRFTWILKVALLRRNLPGRIWTASDLVLSTLKGFSDDRILSKPDGYSSLDDLDLREWLGRHGAHEHTLWSPLVRIIYDAAFSYPQGGLKVGKRRQTEESSESVAAGAALRIILWMAFTYKGAMYYKMRAGMGDVIHTPLYKLLLKREVKFKFFHKVTALRTAKDSKGRDYVASIELQQLARPAGQDYNPLLRVGDLDCWPASPIEAQIHPADFEDAKRAEQFFARPSTSRPVVLSARGIDGVHAAPEKTDDEFDKVIFGIPVGCIPYLCKDLEPVGRWGRQREVEAIQTIAFQLWSKYSLPELGWRDPPPLLSLFWDPLNTWSDMGQVLELEGWPEGERPAMLAYFCGPLPHANLGPEESRADPAVDRIWRLRIQRQCVKFRNDLLSRLHELWPGVGAPETDNRPAVFNWNVLHDPRNRKGRARLRAQYVRGNFDPHARCTLALPKQSQLRISADDTGFTNLTVAGDWTANDVLLACLEGTVQSGIRAARAVSAQKARYRIIGEDLLNPGATFGRSKAGRKKPPDLSPVPVDDEDPRDAMPGAVA
jgi:uncharacterized protein with NAD-binding domain and iron-sulfur cluster